MCSSDLAGLQPGLPRPLPSAAEARGAGPASPGSGVLSRAFRTARAHFRGSPRGAVLSLFISTSAPGDSDGTELSSTPPMNSGPSHLAPFLTRHHDLGDQ